MEWERQLNGLVAIVDEALRNPNLWERMDTLAWVEYRADTIRRFAPTEGQGRIDAFMEVIDKACEACVDANM